MQTKYCSRCQTAKPLSDFGQCKRNSRWGRKDGLAYTCRKCLNAYRNAWGKAHRVAENASNKRYTARHPERRLWTAAKARAKKRGQPFTISRGDITIPGHCPVLGIPLLRGKGGKCLPSSPSLDCIIPALGYVPENIVVISHKANVMKSNATLDEIRSLASWLTSQLSCSSAPHIEAQAA